MNAARARKRATGGYRPGKIKTAEGAVDYSARQVRETPEPFVSSVRGRFRDARGSCYRLPVRRRHRRASAAGSAAGGCAGRLGDRRGWRQIAAWIDGRFERGRRDGASVLSGPALGDPLLLVSDGAPGIIRAIKECFPRSARQRCLAHRMRNLPLMSRPIRGGNSRHGSQPAVRRLRGQSRVNWRRAYLGQTRGTQVLMPFVLDASIAAC
jgi:hypothetical protein